MSAAADNGNGRVTMAVIGTKLDALLGEVHELKADFKTKCTTIDINSNAISRLNTDMDHMKVSVRAWNVINSIGVIGVAILAALGVVPKN